MTIHSDPLIKNKQSVTHINDTIMHLQSKSEMFMDINEYHNLLGMEGLEAALD